MNEESESRISGPIEQPHPRITTRISAWVEESLEQNRFGDRLSYEVTVSVVPSPQGTMQPILLLLLWTPGILLGSMIQHMTALQDPANATQEVIEQAVGNALEEMRVQRSRQAADMNGSPHLGG